MQLEANYRMGHKCSHLTMRLKIRQLGCFGMLGLGWKDIRITQYFGKQSIKK